jgi:glutamate/tyrosine decarboxylase-like PLP-dependent enzyme
LSTILCGGQCRNGEYWSHWPLDELADSCEDQGLWLHVDGAYGAFGILDPNVSHLYTGLERADSVALDPHKWL